MDSTSCQVRCLMVDVRRYFGNDYEQVKSWFLARKMVPPPEDLLPKNGVIMDGIAAGFLYLTDSSVAIIDGYISNKDSVKHERDQAIDKLTLELISIAKAKGFKIIKADTMIKSVGNRAALHGFIELGWHNSYVKELH